MNEWIFFLIIFIAALPATFTKDSCGFNFGFIFPSVLSRLSIRSFGAVLTLICIFLAIFKRQKQHWCLYNLNLMKSLKTSVQGCLDRHTEDYIIINKQASIHPECKALRIFCLWADKITLQTFPLCSDVQNLPLLRSKKVRFERLHKFR